MPIEEKPEPIKRLINVLESTGLRMLQQTYDGMPFVKAVGRSDWNTSTQPVRFQSLQLSSKNRNKN